MLVNVVINRRDATRKLSFVKTITSRYGHISVPAYFPLNSMPYLTGEMDVMITNVTWHQDQYGQCDYKRAPKCMFVRVPSDEIKVNYRGFAWGAGARVLSYAKPYSEDGYSSISDEEMKKPKCNLDIYSITPGKLMSEVKTTEAGLPRHSGVGYIKINPENGKYRLEGVDSFAELDL